MSTAAAAPAALWRRETTPALAAAGVTVVLWASAFAGIRAAGKELAPGPLTLGRLLVGGLALTLLAGARRELRVDRSALRGVAVPLVACGLLWFGGYNLALNAGEQRVDAGTAGMLVGVGPLLLAVLAGVVLREGFPRMLLAGCLVSFAGVVVIGLATAERGASASGVVLCLGAAAAYAVGVVLQKPVVGRLTALQTTLACCLVATVAFVPFAPQLVSELGAADAGAVAWMVYLGVFPTAIAFTTWAFALARTPAGKLGATTYLVPPLSVVLAWALLGERPATLALAGGALCLAGVAVSRRRSGSA